MSALTATVRSEWTKLRSVPAWVLTITVAVAGTVLMSVLAASGSTFGGGPEPTVGPAGRTVTDQFRFYHATLDGDGTITSRVQGLQPVPSGPPGTPTTVPTAWAKAGVIVKDGTTPGSRYAAAMLTAGHGIRLQANYVDDLSATPADVTTTSDRVWLRLTRHGSTVRAEQSVDGAVWRDLGRVDTGMTSRRVEVGLFVASPPELRTNRSLGGTSAGAISTAASATFTEVAVTGSVGVWSSTDVGPSIGDGPSHHPGTTELSDASIPSGATSPGRVVTLTGTGDIAPQPPDVDLVRLALSGVHLGVIPLLAVAILGLTSELRSGLWATSLLATPRRRQVLAAKAIVIATVGFLVGASAAAISLAIALPALRDNGFAPPAFPVLGPFGSEGLRAIAAIGLAYALLGLLSLGIGAVVRSTALAIAVTVLLLLIPQLIVTGLPVTTGRLVVGLTPGAVFTMQSTIERYPQVQSLCLPEDGCVWSQPWTGPAVVAAQVLVLLAVAATVLRRRDA